MIFLELWLWFSKNVFWEKKKNPQNMHSNNENNKYFKRTLKPSSLSPPANYTFFFFHFSFFLFTLTRKMSSSVLLSYFNKNNFDMWQSLYHMIFSFLFPLYNFPIFFVLFFSKKKKHMLAWWNLFNFNLFF